MAALTKSFGGMSRLELEEYAGQLERDNIECEIEVAELKRDLHLKIHHDAERTVTLIYRLKQAAGL